MKEPSLRMCCHRSCVRRALNLISLSSLPPVPPTPTPTPFPNRCDSNRATFEPIPDDGKTYSFDGFVAELGCAKSTAGGYCARVVMDELAAEPDDIAAKCAYFSSCCFGELHRVVKLTDMEARSSTLEAKCPGARAALDLRC
jgi:hypothetical protein